MNFISVNASEWSQLVKSSKSEQQDLLSRHQQLGSFFYQSRLKFWLWKSSSTDVSQPDNGVTDTHCKTASQMRRIMINPSSFQGKRELQNLV